MKTYCLKCEKKQKKTEILDQKVLKVNIGGTMLLSKCAVSKKNQDFQKEQEAKGIVSSLGLKIPLKVIC